MDAAKSGGGHRNEDVRATRKRRPKLLKICMDLPRGVVDFRENPLRPNRLVNVANAAAPDPEQQKEGDPQGRHAASSFGERRAEHYGHPDGREARVIGRPMADEQGGEKQGWDRYESADPREPRGRYGRLGRPGDRESPPQPEPSQNQGQRDGTVGSPIGGPRSREAGRRDIEQGASVAHEVPAPSLVMLQAHVAGRAALKSPKEQRMDTGVDRHPGEDDAPKGGGVNSEAGRAQSD